MMATMARVEEMQDQDGSNIFTRVWTFDPGEIKVWLGESTAKQTFF